jgi:pimeloyl-ACP methyl ester carboxylesterase/DNA-binding CsgD family transcriptional regulator
MRRDENEPEDLIAAIYAATLAPNDYHKTIVQLDGLLFGKDAAAGLAEANALQETEFEKYVHAHIMAARNIQERIGRLKSGKTEYGTFVESNPNPTVLFSRSGKIIAANVHMRGKLGLAPKALTDCITEVDALQRLLAFVSSSKTQDLVAVASAKKSGTAIKSCYLVNRIEALPLDSAHSEMFLLSIVDLGFNDKAVSLFQSAFALTHAETEIAVLLASGARLSEISAQRGVSDDTVRTQIKSIKTKTGAASIPALVRLLCGFSAGVPSAAVLNSGAQRSGKSAMKAAGTVILPDGRRVAYVEQGAANGRPVLMFHNVPYGVHLPEAAIEQAHKDNLRFIAPFRSGYGNSDWLTNASNDALVTQAAQDHKAVLDALGITKAVVISHAGGAPFALRFAGLFPAATLGLIGVGRAPIWRDEWMHAMPMQQRFVFRLTKYFPKLLPVVAWSMIACLESSYARQFLHNGCKESEADSHAVADPDLADLIARSSVEAMHKTVDGFCRDCAISQMDFTEEARSCPHKFRLLHGDDDKIVGLNQSIAFRDEVPGTTLEIVEDAGTLLFFSHWQRVFSAVKHGVFLPDVN